METLFLFSGTMSRCGPSGSGLHKLPGSITSSPLFFDEKSYRLISNDSSIKVLLNTLQISG